MKAAGRAKIFDPFRRWFAHCLMEIILSEP